jgi:hypothetical protein
MKMMKRSRSGRTRRERDGSGRRAVRRVHRRSGGEKKMARVKAVGAARGVRVCETGNEAAASESYRTMGIRADI